MIVDGRTLAAGILERVRHTIREKHLHPTLGVLTCAPTFETEKYLTLKQKKANEVGITVELITLPETVTTVEVVEVVRRLVSHTDGVVVQLPLPAHIDRDEVIRAIPETHDVDALNADTTTVLSPVVGAMREILGSCELSVYEKHVTIIGSGRLVGLPAYTWFQSQGASVSLVTRDTDDIPYYTKNADIIVCGAGAPGFLTPHMVKDGVVVLDAGTSEDGGVLRGDALPAVAEKAAVFTPVPGGIGPMTIAILLENVVKLAEQKHSVL